MDKTVNLGNGANPYNYSDMTGSTLTQPPTSGIWVVTYEGSDWQSLVWTANEPIGTLLNVTARSSINGSTWTAWETAVNGRLLGLAPGGFLQIQVSFERPPNFASPVLYDLRVCKWMNHILPVYLY